MLEHCIWTLYIPATRQDFDAALLEYQELPPIGPAELWPEWELEEGSGEYMALSAGRMEDWDNMESLGEFFSRKFKGPIYAMGAPGEFVYQKGKRKKFSLNGENEYDFSVRLGCPVEYLRPIPQPRTSFSAYILLKVKMKDWEAKLQELTEEQRKNVLKPYHRFSEVPTGLLCYVEYTRDSNGVAIEKDERPISSLFVTPRFPKTTLAVMIANRDRNSFRYCEEKGFEVQSEYFVNATPKDPEAKQLTNVQGETEPIAILKKLGVPLEALGYEEV